MTSITRKTHHYTRIENMVDDLTKDLPLDSLQGALGLLSCNTDADYTGLIAALQQQLPFPVAGATTVSSLFYNVEDDVSCELTIINRPGLKHAICCTEPLSTPKNAVQMRQLYGDCLAALGCKPKLVLLYAPIMENLLADPYMLDFYKAADDVPVFGGMVSADFNSDKFAVMASGQAWPDRILAVALAGDIDPVLATDCELITLSTYSATVTQASGYVVYKVNDMTMLEYLARNGLEQDGKLLSEFPVSISIKGHLADIDGVPEIGIIGELNADDGSAVLSAKAPVGSSLTLGYLSKDMIKITAERCMAKIRAAIEEKRKQGKEYNVLSVASCVSRYFAMVGSPSIEAQAIKDNLPADLALYGYYGSNEICPTRDKQGKIFNRSHADSIVMCAF